MRKINKIIIHCSATPPDMDIGADEIRQWHIDRGWTDIGYHEVITRDGKLQEGREHSEVGAHCIGHNKDSIGICLVGGINDEGVAMDNFTDAQYRRLKGTLRFAKALYPDATIHGHNEFSTKACPSFNVQKWLLGESI